MSLSYYERLQTLYAPDSYSRDRRLLVNQVVRIIMALETVTIKGAQQSPVMGIGMALPAARNSGMLGFMAVRAF